MNTLNQETRVENVTRAGVIEGANVKLQFTRENDKPVRQITVNADMPVENGQPISVYIDWQHANRHVTMAASNCTLEDVPIELFDRLLSEMRAVNGEAL